jgi:putative mRNA 3-end processing factor
MLELRPQGLFCPRGGFYIDPMGRVDKAVLTHAHSDHARRGSKQYFSTKSGIGLVKARLGDSIKIKGIEYGEIFCLGDVKLSFHGAGHIMGSAQVRIEYDGDVWVVSGDYKREFDPTCEPFEVVHCKTFVTEATFGTPAYRWKKESNVSSEMFDWFLENSKKEINTVIFGYSLGKTQRILGLLEPYVTEPIYCHPAARELTECYRSQGYKLAETIWLDDVKKPLKGRLVVAPQSVMKSEYADLIQPCKTAFASGWMAKNSFGFDRGFTLSDHADWDDLVQTIIDTRARDIYVLHRDGKLVKHLKTLGLRAFSVSALSPESRAKNPLQLELL